MTSRIMSSPRWRFRPLAWTAAGALALVAALGLWAYYGSAVFFEMLAAGFANCF